MFLGPLHCLLTLHFDRFISSFRLNQLETPAFCYSVLVVVREESK